MNELIETKTHNGTFKYHNTTIIDDGAVIGNNTIIWHFCHIMTGATIGSGCSLGQNVSIASKSFIGNNVKIQNNVSIYDGVIIEDDVFCGPSIVFTNVINPRSFIKRMKELRETHIKKGCSIGANATIICGVTLGAYSLVGAGSVVTKDIPDYAVVMGVPAKQSGWVCYCGTRLDDSLNCSSCGKKYILNNNSIKENY
jgi:UDP-2-acetamido-3-amino-2,3-dideoxy-glucuronate N-acetyltransferase